MQINMCSAGATTRQMNVHYSKIKQHILSAMCVRFTYCLNSCTLTSNRACRFSGCCS